MLESLRDVELLKEVTMLAKLGKPNLMVASTPQASEESRLQLFRGGVYVWWASQVVVGHYSCIC